MNSQISSRNRPALAALLMVLSASTVLAQSNSVPFKGAFDARDTGGVVQGGTVPLTGSGAGTASLIGRFTFTYKVTLDLATALTTGVIQLVAANGQVTPI